jgi:hypothetical protein
MKILVIGGTRGLGQAIVEKYNADHISTSTGFPIPEKLTQAIAYSLNYDIIINCIPDSNQNKVLWPMYAAHNELGLKTYFITVGSMSWRFNEATHSKRALFDWNESILLMPGTTKHTLLNPAHLWSSSKDAPVEHITPKEILDTVDFLIKHSYTSASVISLIEIKGTVKC